jgi:hypothetical protein
VRGSHAVVSADGVRKRPQDRSRAGAEPLPALGRLATVAALHVRSTFATRRQGEGTTSRRGRFTTSSSPEQQGDGSGSRPRSTTWGARTEQRFRGSETALCGARTRPRRQSATSVANDLRPCFAALGQAGTRKLGRVREALANASSPLTGPLPIPSSASPRLRETGDLGGGRSSVRQRAWAGDSPAAGELRSGDEGTDRARAPHAWDSRFTACRTETARCLEKRSRSLERRLNQLGALSAPGKNQTCSIQSTVRVAAPGAASKITSCRVEGEGHRAE